MVQVLFSVTTIDQDDPDRVSGSTAMTFRFAVGAQDANVFIAFDPAIDIPMQAGASARCDGSRPVLI
jgi:hypothetical protein